MEWERITMAVDYETSEAILFASYNAEREWLIVCFRERGIYFFDAISKYQWNIMRSPVSVSKGYAYNTAIQPYNRGIKIAESPKTRKAQPKFKKARRGR